MGNGWIAIEYHSKSLGFYPQIQQVIGHWSLNLIFKAKLILESGHQKIQYGCKAVMLKLVALKINRLLTIAINNMYMKFETEITKQTSYTPETMPPNLTTKIFNMAARWPCWKWHQWISIGFYPYTHVMCYWNLELLFKAKLRLESGNQKFQHSR